jgi:hypothetical protein
LIVTFIMWQIYFKKDKLVLGWRGITNE